MKEKNKKQSTQVLRVIPGHRFPEGHERFGGRRKRTAQQARDLADQLGVDPLEYMLHLLSVDATEEVEIDAEGHEKRVKVPVGRELKIDICKTLANFFYPRLSATQVTGKDDGPLVGIGLDLTQIMMNPDMVEAAQKLALMMAKPDALPAPADRATALGAPPACDPTSV